MDDWTFFYLFLLVAFLSSPLVLVIIASHLEYRKRMRGSMPVADYQAEELQHLFDDEPVDEFCPQCGQLLLVFEHHEPSFDPASGARSITYTYTIFCPQSVLFPHREERRRTQNQILIIPREFKLDSDEGDDIVDLESLIQQDECDARLQG